MIKSLIAKYKAWKNDRLKKRMLNAAYRAVIKHVGTTCAVVFAAFVQAERREDRPRLKETDEDYGGQWFIPTIREVEEAAAIPFAKGEKRRKVFDQATAKLVSEGLLVRGKVKYGGVERMAYCINQAKLLDWVTEP